MKAFIFTVDAVLALALLSLAPLTLAVLAGQGETEAFAASRQLAFDCLARGATPATCAAWTELEFSDVAGEGAFAAAATHYAPGELCGSNEECLHAFDGLVETRRFVGP
ncbi:MAG: hypothetical protein WC607_03895 [Candidatus Micrarchaeia archaeon]